MSLHKISDEIVKKYNLDDPGEDIVMAGTQKIVLARRPVMKTPFTGYAIVWREDGLYIDVPDGIDKVIPAE